MARITVTNCTISNTTNGLRIKTWPASHALQASGIFFEDIIMDKVQNPIIIDQKYGSRKPEVCIHLKFLIVLPIQFSQAYV